MSQEQQIVAERLRQPKYFAYAFLESNVQLIVDAIYRNEIEPEMRWANHVIDDVIEACISGATFGNQHIVLIENPKIRAALDGVYQRYPRFGRNVANDLALIEGASRYQINFDAKNLIQMVTDDNNLFQSLAKSEQFVEQQSAMREREQMIAYLTENGTTKFTVGRQTFDKQGFLIEHSSSGGRRKVAGDEGFLGWTDEQLRYAVEQVRLKRELKSMDTVALAKRVRAEGQQRLEEKYHGDPTKYVSPMPTAETQAVVLIDPRNGNPITTRKQLIAYITSDRSALARLVRNKQGVTVPEKSLAVDRLLATR